MARLIAIAMIALGAISWKVVTESERPGAYPRRPGIRATPSIGVWATGCAGGLCAALFAVLPAPASAQEGKTLTRVHDPVIVRTGLLAGLPTRETASYRLYRVEAGRLAPIPFQFDERDGAGEVVFDGTAAPREFRLDENDELVFMAKDTGDRLLPELLPAESDGAVEIEAAESSRDGLGWAYLIHFPAKAPPPSPVTYATFDPHANQARTSFYTMEYYPGRNFFTGMRIHPLVGGTGDNMLDRMKLRVHPTFSLGVTSWSPLFTEEQMAVTIDGVKNGPVRAIRRVRQSLDLSRFVPAIPNGTTYTYFYASSFVTPSTFTVPWLVLKLLRDFRFMGVSDFRKIAIGMQYWDAATPQGRRFTGAQTAAASATGDQAADHDWYVVGGTAGTHLQAFIIPEQWRQWGIARGAIFQDDDLAVDHQGPEGEPGTHAAGYSLLNMTQLREPGAYDLNMAVIILPKPYQPGDEVRPLAMLKDPLTVTVHRIK